MAFFALPCHLLPCCGGEGPEAHTQVPAAASRFGAVQASFHRKKKKKKTSPGERADTFFANAFFDIGVWSLLDRSFHCPPPTYVLEIVSIDLTERGYIRSDDP